MVNRRGTVKTTYSTDARSRIPEVQEFGEAVYGQICETYRFMIDDFGRWLDQNPAWEQTGETKAGAAQALDRYCLDVITGEYPSESTTYAFLRILNQNGLPPGLREDLRKTVQKWVEQELQK